MKGRIVLSLSLGFVTPAFAGGLFLPGSGAISTSRAGAAIASADDGEALSVNPAGLAKSTGSSLTISMSLIQYSMEFTRRGAYDALSAYDEPYEGQTYATVENKPKPPLGIGSFQPIPVIAYVTDLGSRVPGLTVAAGLYAPNGYPFRDMSNGYEFNNDPGTPPPPTRYDVMKQESMLLFPTLAAAYRILPELDVGLRLSWGIAKSKSTVHVMGTPGNLDEAVHEDSQFTAEVKDNFVPSAGIGVTYRPTPNIELAATFNSPAVLKTKGTAKSVSGDGLDPDRRIGPLPDDMTSCATGGTFEEQKACISLQLPMNATVGGRYKLLRDDGSMLADVELNVGWENWGKRCALDDRGQFEDLECTSPGQYRVVIDSGVFVGDSLEAPIQKNYLNFGLQDTYSVRLGGSYHVPLATNKVVVRGGVAYDTAAAKTGWLRANFDGAARVTTTVGGAYRTGKWELNVGGGAVLEGENTNPGAQAGGGDCNPTSGSIGCLGNDQQRPLDQRQGPDPTSPLLEPKDQFENPYNQGTIKSHYLLFMLGFTTWF